MRFRNYKTSPIFFTVLFCRWVMQFHTNRHVHFMIIYVFRKKLADSYMCVYERQIISLGLINNLILKLFNLIPSIFSIFKIHKFSHFHPIRSMLLGLEISAVFLYNNKEHFFFWNFILIARLIFLHTMV